MHTQTQKLHETTTTGDNPFQAVNRYKKARLLADLFSQLGVTELSPEPTTEMLELAGKAAGTKSAPSLTTWVLAAHLIKEGS